MSTPYARWRETRVRYSLRRRLVILLMAVAAVSIGTVGWLGYNSVQDLGQNANQISGDALRTQAEEYLRQVTQGEVQRNDLILTSIEKDAYEVARFAARALSLANRLAGSPYWSAGEKLIALPDGQYMNGENDLTSVFLPNFAELSPEVVAELDATAYLELALPGIFESDDNTVAIYIGTENEVTRFYPNIGLGNLLPPDWQVTQRPWYTPANPSENPGHHVTWTPVYTDATGKGLLTTAAAPIYNQRSEFLGVAGVDVTLDGISAAIANSQLLSSGYSFLIDNTGHAIALPEQGYWDMFNKEPEVGESYWDLTESSNNFAPIISQMIAGETGFSTLDMADGAELFVAYAPLETTGWSLANVASPETVLEALGSLETELEASSRTLVLSRLLPAGALIFLVMVGIGGFFANREAEPIRRMAEAAQRIGSGEWDAPLPPQGFDEVGVLSQALARMVQQLRNLMRDLERQVEERTAALAQRSNQLEAAAFVAREAAGIQEQERLLNATVRLISDRFEFYHAGIFLVDESQKYAVLRAASSEGGKKMLARQHKLKIGETGIVGFVAAHGRPRIALDVGEDASYFDNPDLPATRSEMGLPLMVRDRIIGVLDVQSTQAGAFDEEDVAVLQTLADQVALAIENTRLLEESRDRIREIDNLLSRFSRQSWQNTASERTNWRYAYDGVQVRALQDNPADTDPTHLKLPLRLREEVIGYLSLAMEGRKPTPEEVALAEAVANQASLALESAWLYSETQRRAARDQLTTEVASRLRGSLDIDTILQTAVRQVGESLELAEVEVRVGASLISPEFSPTREQ